MDFNRTELRAMLLATGLLLLGASARLGLTPGPAAVEWFLADSLEESGQDLSATRRRVTTGLVDEERAATPLGVGERLDPNSASQIDLRRLPGVGPAKAAAIVAERTAGGAFRSLEDLARDPAGYAQRFGPLHAAVYDLSFAGIMPQRHAGLELVLADDGHDGLALGDQVDDAVIDRVQPLAQLQEFIGGQVAV